MSRLNFIFNTNLLIWLENRNEKLYYNSFRFWILTWTMKLAFDFFLQKPVGFRLIETFSCLFEIFNTVGASELELYFFVDNWLYRYSFLCSHFLVLTGNWKQTFPIVNKGEENVVFFFCFVLNEKIWRIFHT